LVHRHFRCERCGSATQGIRAKSPIIQIGCGMFRKAVFGKEGFFRKELARFLVYQIAALDLFHP